MRNLTLYLKELSIQNDRVDLWNVETYFPQCVNDSIRKPSLLCSLSPKDTHGPIIQAGQNRGRNRCRNKNGQWRRKRSDAGKKRSSDNNCTKNDFLINSSWLL